MRLVGREGLPEDEATNNKTGEEPALKSWRKGILPTGKTRPQAGRSLPRSGAEGMSAEQKGVSRGERGRR